MVYARKRTMRKRSTRKRRSPTVYRKRRYTRSSPVLKLMRWSNADTSTNTHFNFNGTDTVSGQDGVITFSLSNLQSFTEIVNLFDNFRIMKVLYRWVISRTPDSVVTTTYKGLYPRIVWAHDFNDSTVISRTGLMQRAGLREEYMGDTKQKSRWYVLNPSVLAQMYETSLATAYSPKWRQWLDTSDSATLHYGIKYSIDQCYLGMSVRLEAKVILEGKGIS